MFHCYAGLPECMLVFGRVSDCQLEIKAGRLPVSVSESTHENPGKTALNQDILSVFHHGQSTYLHAPM